MVRRLGMKQLARIADPLLTIKKSFPSGVRTRQGNPTPETSEASLSFPRYERCKVSRASVRVVSLMVIFALGACSRAGLAPSLLPNVAAPNVGLVDNGDVPFVGPDPVRRLCSETAGGNRARCFAMARTDIALGAAPALAQRGELQDCRQVFSEGYCPIDLQHAYKLPSLTKGSGRLVAIVDAYGYHQAASDVAEYRKVMGLKPCTESTKCLRIVNQNGESSPLPNEPPPNDDWKGEQSLDLDMVSAICPNCKILLVQTDNDEVDNLYDGVRTAGRLGAKYIGASWGIAEYGGDNAIFNQHGVVIAAAAGDNGGGGRYGGGPYQPCSYTYVVCVGGTHLVTAHNARGWSETVWNDWTFDECGGPCGATGSGCSKKIAKPAWQMGISCTMRSESDISATASLRAPVIVYNSEEGGGRCPSYCFGLYGGTSASAQIISAIFALAGNAATQTGAEGIWKHHTGHTYGVTLGNNVDSNIGVTCASGIHYICYARVGWDGPTGWGTPNDLGAF